LSTDAAGAVRDRTRAGAALSNIVAGWIVVVAGYHVAFISLGALAGAGLLLYLVAMPETWPNAATNRESPAGWTSPEWGRRG
jgi:hypothetical protein